MHALIAASFFHDILHPLGYCASAGSPAAVSGCRGYNFWSGIGSDFGEITLVGVAAGVALTLWHVLNCHAPGCKRIGIHVFHDPDTGERYRLCMRCHPVAKERAKWWHLRRPHPHSLEHIHRQYRKAAGLPASDRS